MRWSVVFTLAPFMMLGCGGGLAKFPTAKVTGKVLCDGKPVSDVRIVFGPTAGKGKNDAGKSGLGTSEFDGTFVVSTYSNQDGAVIGTHNVMVSGPHPEDFPNFKCNCETDGRKIIQKVEVTADGENDFTFNLPPKSAKSKPSIKAEDLADIKAADKTSE